MFGHDSDSDTNAQQHNDQAQAMAVTAPTEPLTDAGFGLSDESTNAVATSAPAVAGGTNGFIMDPVTPVLPGSPVAVAANDPAATLTAAAPNNDLLQIKQQALQHLSPLLGHLDQTPEEKFRTTMMMIQASDDQTMVSQAYTAAQAIPDEKVRAQALLDIVNEINYFTQQHSASSK